MEGVNLTMIKSKNFCKYYNVPQVQQECNKKVKQNKAKT
jgi:hypothetical protein